MFFVVLVSLSRLSLVLVEAGRLYYVDVDVGVDVVSNPFDLSRKIIMFIGRFMHLLIASALVVNVLPVTGQVCSLGGCEISITERSVLRRRF